MVNLIKTFTKVTNKASRMIGKPVQKLMGIGDTTIKKISRSKYTPNFVSKPLQAVSSYANTVAYGRNDYQPSARALIKQYGDKVITHIDIIRQPIQSFINTAFNALTFGQFQKKLEEMPYDKLFHLRMVITFQDGQKLQVEKNEVINMQKKIDTVKGQEVMPVPINKSITLNQLLEGGKSVLKDQYFSYRAFGNNCQDYQMALLKGSNLLTPQLANFIKQDVEELSTINPYLKKIANAFTDLGGKFNEIIHGTGIHKKYSKTHRVQSVIFNKKQWTIPRARKWLKENNYIYSDVDKKVNFIRFRQIDTDTIDKDIYSYTTHRLPDGIELIIAYKKKQIKGKGINNKNMRSCKGGKIIIDDSDSDSDIEGTSSKRTSVNGGALVSDLPNPRLSLSSNAPVPDFKKTGKRFTTRNLLNNLTSDDIRNLRKLFMGDIEEEKKTKEKVEKIRKATKARVKRETKAKPKTKKPVRGTIEGKREALKKYKK